MYALHVDKDSGISGEMVDSLRVLPLHHVGLRGVEHLVPDRRHRKKCKTQNILKTRFCDVLSVRLLAGVTAPW